MLTLGIDCGVTGAISCLSEDGQYRDVEDLPLITHGKTRWIDGTELLTILRRMRGGEPCMAFVEKTQATPKIGVTTSNSMGLTLGSTLAILQIAGCAIELVYPQVWKRALGLIDSQSSDREKKRASLDRARLLFPRASLERVCDNGRAEALLIAWYALNRKQQRELVV